MRAIEKIVIHCSATPRNKDFSAEDIRDWHVKGNGWSDIGYHYVIRLDGTIEYGRMVDKYGREAVDELFARKKNRNTAPKMRKVDYDNLHKKYRQHNSKG